MGRQRDVEEIPEDPDLAGVFLFDERSVRHRFIRKVYALLGLQLVLTAAIAVALMFTPGVPAFLLRYWWITLLLGLAYLVLVLVLTCVKRVRRTFPANLIILLLITAIMGVMSGFMCALADTDLVLIALGITVAVVLALTLFAFQTRWDFTGWGTYLLVAGIVLMCVGIACIFVSNRILHIVYCSIGILIFSAYLIYDTQLLMGGKHKFSVSPEDYVTGALSLYVDVIMLFWYILDLLVLTRR